MRRIHQSQLEIFVEGYLKKLDKTNNLRGEQKFLLKAKTLINNKIHDPCCDDPDAITDLYTPRDNQLTNTVRTLLSNMSLVRNSKTLTRTIAVIDNVLVDPCC